MRLLILLSLVCFTIAGCKPVIVSPTVKPQPAPVQDTTKHPSNYQPPPHPPVPNT